MSNDNDNDNDNDNNYIQQDKSSSESSIEVRTTHAREEEETKATVDVGSSAKVNSNHKCVIKARADARPDHCLHGVTVCVPRGKLHHQVRVHTEDPVEQSKDHQRDNIVRLRGPTLDALIPWMFHLEMQEDSPEPKPETPQICGPSTCAKSKRWDQCLKRKRDDPSP